MKAYTLLEEDLQKLRSIRDRLYSEKAMSADEMRDTGHRLDGVIRTAEQLESDEEASPSVAEWDGKTRYTSAACPQAEYHRLMLACGWCDFDLRPSPYVEAERTTAAIMTELRRLYGNVIGPSGEAAIKAALTGKGSR